MKELFRAGLSLDQELQENMSRREGCFSNEGKDRY